MSVCVHVHHMRVNVCRAEESLEFPKPGVRVRLLVWVLSVSPTPPACLSCLMCVPGLQGFWKLDILQIYDLRKYFLCESASLF